MWPYVMAWLTFALWGLEESNAKLVNLRAAGASFPSPVYQKWISNYKSLRRPHVVLNATYDVIGSGSGKKLILGHSDLIEYAGTDSLVDEEDYDNHTSLQMYPVIAGAVVMSFNLPGIKDLNLTRQLIVGIYNGTITNWNDPGLLNVNADVSLPNKTILVVARADKSGTTEIFTTALCAFDPAWNATYGTFTAGVDPHGNPYHWEPGVMSYYGTGNRGISGLLLSIPFTISYISVADASDAYLHYAYIYNQEDFLVGPGAINVQAAMDANWNAFSSRFTSSLVDLPGQLSYPIAGYSYFLLHLQQPDCDSAVALYRYMKWFIFDETAQNECESSHFAPLSLTVGRQVVKHLNRHYRCNGYQVVQELADKQEQQEEFVPQPWALPLIVIASILSCMVFLLLVYVGQRELKLNAALLKGQWAIPLRSIYPLKRYHVDINSITNGIYSIEDLSFTEESYNVSAWQLQQFNFGQYQARGVWLQPTKLFSKSSLRLSTKRSLISARALQHTNVSRFFGLTQVQNMVHFVMALDSNGLLHDILRNRKYPLDDNFKFCLALDVVAGMMFLHHEDIIHGYLTTSSCCVDEKWNVKISDWAYYKLANKQNDASLMNRHALSEKDLDKSASAKRAFWWAPEMLRNRDRMPTKESDVYSFAIVLIEIFTQREPYDNLIDTHHPSDILLDITMHDLRPEHPPRASLELVQILNMCWIDEPGKRPPFKKLKKLVTRAKPSKKGVLDCLMEALEVRTKELAHAIDGMQTLLYQILPPTVAIKLQNGETVEAESYESVTIYFSDVVGFTTMSSTLSPMEVVQFLNSLYTCFDNVLDLFDVYKVETIGDAYMVISGLPNRNGSQHAGEIASVALELMEAANNFKIPNLPNEPLRLRAGMHSGPVASGVVGLKMPRFCLFGDAVNTASRMESTSLAMKIQVSDDCKSLLDSIGGYITERRGTVSVKGKGNMCTHWLKGKGVTTEEGC